MRGGGGGGLGRTGAPPWAGGGDGGGGEESGGGSGHSQSHSSKLGAGAGASAEPRLREGHQTTLKYEACSEIGGESSRALRHSLRTSGSPEPRAGWTRKARNVGRGCVVGHPCFDPKYVNASFHPTKSTLGAACALWIGAFVFGAPRPWACRFRRRSRPDLVFTVLGIAGRTRIGLDLSAKWNLDRLRVIYVRDRYSYMLIHWGLRQKATCPAGAGQSRGVSSSSDASN